MKNQKIDMTLSVHCEVRDDKYLILKGVLDFDNFLELKQSAELSISQMTEVNCVVDDQVNLSSLWIVLLVLLLKGSKKSSKPFRLLGPSERLRFLLERVEYDAFFEIIDK